MAFVDASGQVDSVFCLCCSRSFLKPELSGHVTSGHFGFLPFACTSCDFTAASEREVLEHAKENRHIPYAVDHSSSKPYLSLLVRLVVSHCKTFAQTSDFAAILAELNSQIAAHENGFNGIIPQPEFTLAETPQQPDYESSLERSSSTPNSAQNANPRLRDDPQSNGANSESDDISNTKQQQFASAGVFATVTSKTRLPKQTPPALRARQSSAALPKPGSANKYANASAPCALCAPNKQFNGHEKEGHVLQHLGPGSTVSRSDHHKPKAFFAEVAATWQQCFPASGELAGTEVPASLEDVAAKQQGHTTGGLANDLNQLNSQQRLFQLSTTERPYPIGHRSSSINAADVIARNELTSFAEDMDVDSLHQNAVVLHNNSNAVALARAYECQICSALVPAKASTTLKYHAMRKHFTAPQKVFECSKCGYGSNEWPSYVLRHVRKAHPGQQGKDVRVIDRSAELANEIHACLEACFPGAGLKDPASNVAADKNGNYHYADSEAATGHSSENPPEFDLPGPSGYQGPEVGLEDVVAMQRGHMTGGLANDLNRFIAQQREHQFVNFTQQTAMLVREPTSVEDAHDEESSKERPHPDRSDLINAADVIARNQLTSDSEDMDVDRLYQNAEVMHDNGDAVTPARGSECQICSARVVGKPHVLKLHAMRKHFVAPQKVFECSKCGWGNNEWFSHVTQHVKRVHRGQKGKGVRVIDHSAKLANQIHACLEACFPDAGFAPPPSKGAAVKNGSFHRADSEVAGGHSSESLQEFDLPGPSGYEDQERGPSQEFEVAEMPWIDGFDKCEEEDGFVNVVVKAPSADVKKMFAPRYRQCFAKNPNRSAGYHCKGTSRESGSSKPASSDHQNAAAQRRISAALTAKANGHECQICAESVAARTYSLKYHAMHKHFTAPQKVFECSKCGFGNNEWRCHVVQHVKKVHRGQQGKGVRVIDRSVKFSIKIHACLKACFPEAEFAPPWGKVAPKKIDGYHAADSGVVAAGYSSENPPEFDLPGSSGYAGPELDASQEFEDAKRPSVDGFDESDEDDGFVNVAVKAEQINDRAASSFTDTAAASAFR